MKHNLLLVVDMINGFTKQGALADQCILNIVDNIKLLIQSVKREDVIFIADSHDDKALEFTSFPTHCVNGSYESQIIDELIDDANIIVYKNSTNAFYKLGTEIYDEYQNIVICGCCSDICIMSLALSLKTYFNEYQIDKRVIVIDDAIETYDAPNHNRDYYNQFALNIMAQSGIIIKSCKEYINEI